MQNASNAAPAHNPARVPTENGIVFVDGSDEFREVFIVDDTTAEEEIPVFPELKVKAPPIPPPIAEQRPPVPPPVNISLTTKVGSVPDPPVQLPTRNFHQANERRVFPRRQMSLVAAVLILFCFGLGFDSDHAPQSQVLETSRVAFADAASFDAVSSPVAQVDLSEPAPAVDDIVEELESDSDPDLPLSTAANSRIVSASAKTSELAKVDNPQPTLLFPESKKSAEPAEVAAEFEESPEDESEVCELALDSKRMLGTAVRWAETANEAAMIANDQGKLVYLIQVSGNFEIPEFT